jgi:hypothetical protein
MQGHGLGSSQTALAGGADERSAFVIYPQLGVRQLAATLTHRAISCHGRRGFAFNIAISFAKPSHVARRAGLTPLWSATGPEQLFRGEPHLKHHRDPSSSM